MGWLTPLIITVAVRRAGRRETTLLVAKFVSGAFEIPNIISKNIKKFDAFIALGCIIKGETDHYHFISNAVTIGLMNLSIQSKKPIGFGILTCNNLNQAKSRASILKKNKGKEVALGVISTLKSK